MMSRHDLRWPVLFADEYHTKELKGRRDALRGFIASGNCSTRVEMDYDEELKRIEDELNGRREND